MTPFKIKNHSENLNLEELNLVIDYGSYGKGCSLPAKNLQLYQDEQWGDVILAITETEDGGSNVYLCSPHANGNFKAIDCVGSICGTLCYAPVKHQIWGITYFDIANNRRRSWQNANQSYDYASKEEAEESFCDAKKHLKEEADFIENVDFSDLKAVLVDEWED